LERGRNNAFPETGILVCIQKNKAKKPEKSGKLEGTEPTTEKHVGRKTVVDVDEGEGLGGQVNTPCVRRNKTRE